MTSELTRKTIVMNDDGTVTQTLIQIGTYSLSVFLIFAKTWSIKRTGTYSYRRTEAGWRIFNVEVLSENVE
ncbi:MAG: hypothetical protein KDA85_04360 [Planctomycetaceae bacterium]|nr:hypothetical protein [Planctomycetaceae bacterium]